MNQSRTPVTPPLQICKVIPAQNSPVIKITRTPVVDLENAAIQVIRRLRPHVLWALKIGSKTSATLEVYFNHDGFWIDRKTALLRDNYEWDGESSVKDLPSDDYVPDPVQVDRTVSVVRQELNVFDLSKNVNKKSSVVLNLQFKDHMLFGTELRRIRRLS